MPEDEAGRGRREYPPPPRFGAKEREQIGKELHAMLAPKGSSQQEVADLVVRLERVVASGRDSEGSAWSRIGAKARSLSEALNPTASFRYSLQSLMVATPADWQTFFGLLEKLAKLPSKKGRGPNNRKDSARRSVEDGVVWVLREADLPCGKNSPRARRILAAVLLDVFGQKPWSESATQAALNRANRRVKARGAK